MTQPPPDSPRFDREALLQLAQLSKLALRDDELETLAAQLSDIVAYVEVLGNVDTDGVEPLIHPNATPSAPRADVVTDVIGPQGIAQAAAVQEEQVRVPKVIE